MPSVRVRRSIKDYAVLPERQAGTQSTGRSRSNERSRPLAALFHRAQPAQPEPEALPRASRPRASTSASQKPEDRPISIVQQYCTGQRGRSGDDTRPRANSRALAAVFNQERAAASPERRSGSVLSHGQEGISVGIVLDPADARGAVGSALSLHSELQPASLLTEPEVGGRHHHDDVVEHLSVIGELFLDVQFWCEANDGRRFLTFIDNHISTVSNLSNVSNSIIIPNLPIYNRRPIVTLPTLAEDDASAAAEKGKNAPKDNLDRHVEDVLTNRNKIKRGLAGFWGYIKTPMGFVSFVYGFLCAFWGAAIVLFLAKMINLHNEDRQGFWVEVSSQVENGKSSLFTVTGVGLIPWRIIDTYRVAKIWHYRQVTRKLRRKANIPALIDGNDLPDPIYNPNYVHVLSEKQQNDLHYQQQQFMSNQTWYRPHETETHKAFPIKTALFICLLIDFNSVFQVMLCACMWSMNRFQRPAWTTGTLIPASFLCGIAAGVLIWRGGNQTKKVKEVEQRLREALDMESRGIGIAGYTDTQPTGEGFAVITKPNQSRDHIPSPLSPMSPGSMGLPSPDATTPRIGDTVNSVRTPIGQSANRDPAVMIPAAPQAIVSDVVPHPDVATSKAAGPSRLAEVMNAPTEGGSVNDPETPMVGVDNLPLLAERREQREE
ncbi:hypothetical protein FRC07_003291 [Ceratobasidium sp. 392]|nr:hypothetical protein FRC07_003291 [Ceratobasidium sp. 392]